MKARARRVESACAAVVVAFGAACATSRISTGCIAPCTPESASWAIEELLAGRGNDHDFPAALAEMGDTRAIPAIIAVLERHPADSDGTMICTRSHALHALRTLTGVDAGVTTEAWQQWWAEHASELVHTHD